MRQKRKDKKRKVNKGTVALKQGLHLLYIEYIFTVIKRPWKTTMQYFSLKHIKIETVNLWEKNLLSKIHTMR